MVPEPPVLPEQPETVPLSMPKDPERFMLVHVMVGFLIA